MVGGGKKFLLYLLAPPDCQDLFVVGTILPSMAFKFILILFLPLFLSLSDKSASASGVGFLFEFWRPGFHFFHVIQPAESLFVR